MREYPLMEQGHYPAPEDAILETRVHELEDRVDRLQQEVARWEERHGRVVELAERIHQQLERSGPGSLPSDPGALTRAAGPGTPITVEAQPASQPAPRRGGERLSSWLALDILRDVRDLFAVWADSRYSTTWTFNAGIVVVLALFVLSWFVLPWGFSHVFDLALAFVLFKILSRELARYRDAIARFPF